jgi:fluoride ion exporter CrcB/FEX
VETDLLLKDGHGGIALAYMAASLAAGFTAVWLGIAIARMLGSRTGGLG